VPRLMHRPLSALRQMRRQRSAPRPLRPRSVLRLMRRPLSALRRTVPQEARPRVLPWARTRTALRRPRLLLALLPRVLPRSRLLKAERSVLPPARRPL